MQEAQFYKKSTNLAVVCELCNHRCLIKNQALGICGVRKNLNGKLYSLAYGYPVAINIDPIEKKPLFHFQPGSSTFSLGTLGCNFKCGNCQNWGISQAIPLNPPLSRGKIIEPEEVIRQALKAKCQSIAYTYNEPTIFAEYALDIMKLAKQNNLKNVWVSNGYMSQSCLKAIIPYLDAINVDLKSMDENFYQKNCQAKLKPVLQNLIDIKKSGVHLEITTLIIPNLSDDLAMLKKLAKFIFKELGSDVPWHLSKFSPEISWKLKECAPTPEDAIFKAHELGKNAGLKYVYVGNIYSTDKENTYCPNCGQLAIKRLGYSITRYDKNGHCANCQADLQIIT